MEVEIGLINRYTYYFDDQINKESVQTLIDILSMQDKVDLFFSTEGGEVVCMKVLIHYLNSRKDDVTIHLTDIIMSAGTFLLTHFKGKVILDENLDCILFHKLDRLVYTRRAEQTVDQNILLKQLDKDNEIISARLSKLGLTKQEVKDYDKGKDVVLYREDFTRLNLK